MKIIKKSLLFEVLEELLVIKLAVLVDGGIVHADPHLDFTAGQHLVTVFLL